VVDITGFVDWRDPLDLNELLSEKRRRIVEALDRCAETIIEKDLQGERQAQIEDESLYEICAKEYYWLRKDIETVEGVFFLYKFKRNQWTVKQPKGADLTDGAYRKAEKLSVYIKKYLGIWRTALDILSRGMPRFCASRVPLYNIWTMEEKVVWVDF
jgi:hypothetical protein